MNGKRLVLTLAAVVLSGSAVGQLVGTYVDLHDFGETITSGQDGMSPYAVAFDKTGNMYGATQAGGANGLGMVWELKTSGTYLDLHDFGGTAANSNGKSGPDGREPYAGVTLDAGGNIYGTTWGGGSNGGGIVWKIAASGDYTDLHDFGGFVTTAGGSYGTDGNEPYAGVTVDGASNLYGTAELGGRYQTAGMVWEITASGTYLDLHDFGSKTVTNANGTTGPDGAGPLAGVSFDSAGNMVGTTVGGGPNDIGYAGSGIGAGMVWEITASGTYRDLHDFGGTVLNANGKSGPDGQQPYASVTFDSKGDMVGTTYSGGAGTGGMVWEITASGSYKDLHDFGGTVQNADGTTGPDGVLPTGGVTFDTTGNMFGTASNGGANKIDSSGNYGGTVWELSTTGSYWSLHNFGGTVQNAAGSSGLDGQSPSAGVTFDPAGNLCGSAWQGGPNAMSGRTGAGLVWAIKPAVPLKSISLSPISVQGGTSSAGTVTLSQAAPSAGVTVPLSSSNSSATVPAYITVAAGATTATFTITTAGVDSKITVTITAGSGAGSQSATLTITPAKLTSVGLSPTSVVGGNNATGTVTLSGPAGPSGATVALSSSDAAAVVSASVTVPAGQVSATFTVDTNGVSDKATSTITANLNSDSQAATISVTPASLAWVTVSPTVVQGGNPSKGTAVLTGNAGPRGVLVTLSSGNAAATVPKTATVVPDAASAAFAIKTIPVSGPKVAKLTAKVGKASSTVSLTINPPPPPALVSVILNPIAVTGGSSSIGTVTLSRSAMPGGTAVKLSSSSKSGTVPSSVTVASGKTSATFTVKTAAVSTQASATITASLNGVSQTATLTIGPPNLKGLTVSPTSVKGGKPSTGSVTIGSAAPTGGLVIALSSSSTAASIPSSISIAAGKISATFTVKTKPVSASTTATITATLGSTSKTAVLTISP
jgi:uncharacterized repeat protein (TIGR03803 family)